MKKPNILHVIILFLLAGCSNMPQEKIDRADKQNLGRKAYSASKKLQNNPEIAAAYYDEADFLTQYSKSFCMCNSLEEVSKSLEHKLVFSFFNLFKYRAGAGEGDPVELGGSIVHYLGWHPDDGKHLQRLLREFVVSQGTLELYLPVFEDSEFLTYLDGVVQCQKNETDAIMREWNDKSGPKPDLWRGIKK